MTAPLERDLVQTLEAAASSAPVPPVDLLQQVDRRRRHRQQRSKVVLVATAATCVLAGTAWGFGVLPSTDQHTVIEPSRRAPGTPLSAAPVEKLWPQAVHRIGNRLPDGRKFLPRTFVDERTLLVSVQASFEKAGELRLYDLDAGTTRKVTDIRTPDDATIFPSDFTLGDGHVAWWISREGENGKSSVELWAVPLAGATAHRVTSLATSDSVEALAVAAGQVHWSLEHGGVYQAPLSGGDAALIDGTKDYAIVSWPWIGSPVPSFDGSDSELTSKVSYQTLRNVQTGEETIAEDRDGLWACRIHWCIGTVDESSVAERRDRTSRQSVPGYIDPATQFGGALPARDRFVLLMEKAAVIHDLETGRSGRMAPSPGGGFRMMGDDRMYYTETKNGFQLLDLAAI